MRGWSAWLAVLALLAQGPVGAAAADSALAGGWRGTWTKNGDVLPVTANFAQDGASASGTFSSDDLQVADIPFSRVTVDGGKVHIVLKGDATTMVFDGMLDGDRLTGRFTDGGGEGSFALDRAVLPAASLRSRDIVFHNGEVTLAGTVLLPSGADPHPAVLLLQGSGPEARFANRYLAGKLAESGVVALIFDKRGAGQSSGDWRDAGFEELAGDAVAGLRFLKTLPEVDPRRIGIYGHSQGGTLAPLVAVRAGGDLDFIVAAAPGGIDPAALEAYSVGNSIGLDSLPPNERRAARAYVRAVVDTAYRGKPRAELDALAARLKDRAWYFEPPPPDDAYWRVSRRIAGFDPSRWWRRVRVPVLLLFAGHDARVPTGPSSRAIRRALAAGGDRAVTFKLYPDADHTFSLVGGSQVGWPKHVPDYGVTVAHWVLSLR